MFLFKVDIMDAIETDLIYLKKLNKTKKFRELTWGTGRRKEAKDVYHGPRSI